MSAGDSPHRAKVITVSDGVHHGSRVDTGGAAVAEYLASHGFEVEATMVIPDGADAVAAALTQMCSGFAGVVVTTGGTGFGPRDQTPEGTAAVIERDAPGLAEAMRAISPFGRLSRGRSGTVGDCIVLNLPGSPTGAVEQLGAVIDVLAHAVDLIVGRPSGH